MRLGLSSAAAPDADLDALLTACAQRGLGVLELRAGDAHGVDAEVDPADGVIARERAAAAGITIGGYWTASYDGAERLARTAEALDAPILVAADEAIDARIAQVRRIEARGGTALVVVGGPADTWLDAVISAGIHFAWEVDAAHFDVSADTERVLRAGSDGLKCVRLLGGGPETALQEGRGIGPLMGRLAMRGYAGPLLLAPSSSRYRVAWASWLGRRGGWGCGSKVGDADVVPLSTATGGSR